MSVFKRPGQSVYSYDFLYRRQRFSGSTGCKTKREAERFEEDERKRVASNKIDDSKPMTLKAALAKFWNELGKHHKNEADTLRNLDWLESKIGGGTLISSISDATIARAIASRRGSGVSNATVNRTVTEPLRAVLRRSEKMWKQEVQPIDWKSHLLKEPQERVREATREEEALLMKTIRGDYQPALRFAILTGCRRAEIVNLEWAKVDFFNREFTVTGKGDMSRTIPMTNAIYNLLWGLKDNHPTAVFTFVAVKTRDGKMRGKHYPITMDGFKTEWRRTLERAKITDYRFHDNRHTAATRLVRSAKNLKVAQKLLGHSDIKTTSRYAHVTNDDLRNAMEATEPVPKSAENKP